MKAQLQGGKEVARLFDLTGKVAVITGGAGLLGQQHARAVAEAGGSPVLLDIKGDQAERWAKTLEEEFGVASAGLEADVTQPQGLRKALAKILQVHGRVDILVNNAAHNPKVEEMRASAWSRFEDFPLELWNDHLAVGLTGTFLASQIFGRQMAQNGGGVIVNIASTLGLVGPDQRIYIKPGLPAHEQPIKAASYSAIKGGILALTKYLATYWAGSGIRVNALSPGGVYDGQEEGFVKKYADRTPLGRMARKDEYKGALLFLCSEASSYMTGANLVVDGGWTAW